MSKKESSPNQPVEFNMQSVDHTSNASFGLFFQEARLAKKLSIEDVVNAIHLSEKQVYALENNLFSVLPEPMITRGFIRNYANFLEIDFEPLLNTYRQLVPQVENTLMVRSNVNKVITTQTQQPWLFYVLGSILVLLFLIAWFYYVDTADVKPAPLANEKSIVGANSSNQTTVPIQATTVTQNNVVSPTVTAPVGGVVNSPTTENTSSEPMTNQQTTFNPSITTTANSPATSAPPVQNSNVAPINSTQNAVMPTVNNQAPVTVNTQATNTNVEKKVSMSFSAPSWVRVLDKNNHLVFEKTIPAGATEAFDGEQPFKITIGNASAATVKYLGRDVDLAPSTSRNITKLVLE